MRFEIYLQKVFSICFTKVGFHDQSDIDLYGLEIIISAGSLNDGKGHQIPFQT